MLMDHPNNNRTDITQAAGRNTVKKHMYLGLFQQGSLHRGNKNMYIGHNKYFYNPRTRE